MIEDEDNEEEYVEMNDVEYLRDLSERLRGIPVEHGIDGYDIDRLLTMASDIA